MALREQLRLRPRQDLGDVALQLGRAHVPEFDRQQIPVHAQHGWDADGQVHVRAPLLRAKLQKRVDTRQGDNPNLLKCCTF